MLGSMEPRSHALPALVVALLLVLGLVVGSSLGLSARIARSEDGGAGTAPSLEPGAAAALPAGSHSPRRLISLNPSLTAIVLRLGEGERLVGVDDYSARLLEEVADRPRVGGLFDPSLESVVALRPDRVLLVAGVDQQSQADALEALGIGVEIFRNERLEEVLENVERLGHLLGREREAADRIEAILAMQRAVAEARASRSRPATVAVLDRAPLYVVGGETFLDQMLEAVGARNLARALGPGYPRGSIEWLVAAGPELLLDMTPGSVGADPGADFWSRWPSLPAVRDARVVNVEASRMSMPGPDLDLAMRDLAIAVHGEAIAAAIDAALARPHGAEQGAASEGASRR
jgi:iron complex transport system substrate-binding protein